VSAWFGNDSVAVVPGGLEHLDLGLVQVGCRVPSSQVQQLHRVAQLPPHTHQRVRNLDRLLERLAPVLSRATVEVDSPQVDPHLLYLFKSFLSLLYRVQIVAEFVTENSSQSCLLLLNRNPPENFHFGSHLLNFD